MCNLLRLRLLHWLSVRSITFDRVLMRSCSHLETCVVGSVYFADIAIPTPRFIGRSTDRQAHITLVVEDGQNQYLVMLRGEAFSVVFGNAKKLGEGTDRAVVPRHIRRLQSPRSSAAEVRPTNCQNPHLRRHSLRSVQSSRPRPSLTLAHSSDRRNLRCASTFALLWLSLRGELDDLYACPRRRHWGIRLSAGSLAGSSMSSMKSKLTLWCVFRSTGGNAVGQAPHVIANMVDPPSLSPRLVTRWRQESSLRIPYWGSVPTSVSNAHKNLSFSMSTLPAFSRPHVT
ncbi:hypothetical protein H4582DRAFT_2200417 [Lactarius indigo]|nr:hypothetical protein H4582DRAFT_2200417 [Lactarius indigo]